MQAKTSASVFASSTPQVLPRGKPRLFFGLNIRPRSVDVRSAPGCHAHATAACTEHPSRATVNTFGTLEVDAAAATLSVSTLRPAHASCG